MSEIKTISDMTKASVSYQKSFEWAQDELVKAKAEYVKAKAALQGFNEKYGRVVKLLEEED